MKLAGNVGHQFALTAGLITAMDLSDVTVSIDADLQDDVAVIEEMIDKFHNGCDIVYGVRKERKTDTFFKRTTAQGFYKVMEMMGVKTVYNHADFRLMSKRAVEQFSKYQETNLFLRGMMPLIGYQTDCVYYDRKERVAGESKYPLKKMLALAFNGISSFSVKPISMILGSRRDHCNIKHSCGNLCTDLLLHRTCGTGMDFFDSVHLVLGRYSADGRRTGRSVYWQNLH